MLEEEGSGQVHFPWIDYIAWITAMQCIGVGLEEKVKVAAEHVSEQNVFYNL